MKDQFKVRRLLGLFITRVAIAGVMALVAGCGSSSEEPPTQDVAEIWTRFAAEVGKSGAEFLRDNEQEYDIDRAEGLRYLAQQLSASVQEELIRQTGEIPLLRVGATTLQKYGIDSADAKYTSAVIDSSGVYRLTGYRGTSRLVALQTLRVSIDGDYEAYDSLSQEALQPDADGNIEVMIALKRPQGWAGPWLRLDPNSDSLHIREYHADWANERPGKFQLTRVDDHPPRPPLTTSDANGLLEAIAYRFEHRPGVWLNRINPVRLLLENKVRMKTREEMTGSGLADNIYGAGWYNVAEDEALIIEIESVDALMWSIELANIWAESFDYINHLAAYNSEQARPDSDGVYRFVIAHQDPGVLNWLDPAGHPEGFIHARYQNSKNSPPVKTRLVKLSELRGHLPADSPKVNASERVDTLAARRAHAANRYAP